MKRKLALHTTAFLMMSALFTVMFVCIHVYGIGWTTTEVVSTESTLVSSGPSLGVGSDGTAHIACAVASIPNCCALGETLQQFRVTPMGKLKMHVGNT